MLTRLVSFLLLQSFSCTAAASLHLLSKYSHYENMSMLYTATFYGFKKDNFQMKNCDDFLIFAQNIDCGYTLEPPQ